MRESMGGRGRRLVLLSLACAGALLSGVGDVRSLDQWAPASVASAQSTSLPQAGAILGTLRFPATETPLFAARGHSLFVLVIPSSRAAAITVMRVGPGGAVTSRRVPFPLPYYLMDVSAGPDGVYAGTAVIKRFTDVPDVLVRIDPRTLAVRARASFPSRVAAVERGRWLWASIGDGRVARLDPRTLEIKASRRLLPLSAVRTLGLSLSTPALGLGNLWVLTGDKRDLELARLDPLSLAVRSTTHLPFGVARAVYRVLADSRHVYLVGDVIVGVDGAGKLIGRPVGVPGLGGAAVIHRAGLVGMTCCGPASVLLDARGRIVARTGLRDVGLPLAVSGDNAWLLGDAGQGNGIVHVRLADR